MMQTESLSESVAAGVYQMQALPQWLTVSSNLDPKLGGVSAIMPHLLAAIRRAGAFETALAAFCGPGEDVTRVTSGVRNHERYPLAGWRALVDRALRQRLAQQMETCAGVHIHGIWQDHCAMAAQSARALGKPYLVSAHGMLDPWALRQKRWKKAAYLHLIEKRTFRSAGCLHALTVAEAEAYRRIAPGVPVAVIPNGISVPENVSSQLFLHQFPQLRGKRVVLFLGRIHPKKGLDLLCEAWGRIHRSFPDARLVLAGPDAEGRRAIYERQVAASGSAQSVLFPGMLTGELKWSALKAASLFVLPSYSEGLSVSVLEALAIGIPVLISNECHVEGVRAAGGGWEIRPVLRELEDAMAEALSSEPDALSVMGKQGRELARRQYDWDAVGEQMSEIYEWLSGALPRFAPR